MRVCLLTIGDELLSGKTINTNASWISQKLAFEGCSVIRHLTVPDKETDILDGLSNLFNLSTDVILCTGGLGPTNDDITRYSIFKFFKSNPVFDELYWSELVSKFSQLGYSIPESNKSQAIIPHNGEVFPNPIGSARGYLFYLKGITLMALPGVPPEMEVMVEQTVIPWIRKNNDEKLTSINIRTTGIPESSLHEKISLKKIPQNDIKIGYYPSIFGVDLRLSGSDEAKIKTAQIRLTECIKDYIYTVGEDPIENIVVDRLINEKLTISFAESCTGGLLGHRITQVEGSSKAFKGGMVVYSNEAKVDQLKISQELLDEFGAVSQEVALEMAKNVRGVFSSDIGVSITGIAGPGGGSDSKPVGLVYVGYFDSKTVDTYQFNFHSNRQTNKIRTSQSVFNQILKNIN